jgi:hypothetical protein
MFVAGLCSVIAVMAVAQVTAGLERSRAWAAARFLAGQMGAARIRAVSSRASVALRFTDDGREYRMFIDRNRNGVRTMDIAEGIDPPLGPSMRLGELFPGVRVAISTEAGGGDGVQFGAADIVTFTPLGTATAGTVYIQGRDGSQFAVRVLGVTARTRVLRFNPSTREWVGN